MTPSTDDLEKARGLLKQSRRLLDEQEDDPKILGAWMSAWLELPPRLAVASQLFKQLEAAAGHIRSLLS